VVKVDEQAVVASHPVEPYESLPMQAGLIQLLESGALTQDDDGNFIIQRKIRLPADLSFVRMRLPAGVPEPDGTPSNPCLVVSDETGLGLALDPRLARDSGQAVDSTLRMMLGPRPCPLP
jgi:hypothetical protein